MPHLQRLLNLFRIFNQRQVSSLRVCDTINLNVVLIFSAAVTTPTGSSSEISSSDEETAPLPLEVDIPKERLPDVLVVSDTGKLPGVIFKDPFPAAGRSLEKFLACNPIKYVRKYPVCIPPRFLKAKYIHLRTSTQPSSYRDTATCDILKDSDTLEHHTIGQLDLSGKQKLGDGSHSHVYLAPLSLPACAGPSLCREVAVKIAMYWYEQDMLVNEAKIYDKFPYELQDFTPSSTPIVPRFYGYYEPSCESVDGYKGDDGDEKDAITVREHVRMLLQRFTSPLLLLEPCGVQVNVDMLSQSNK
jgi:hypothetical protein